MRNSMTMDYKGETIRPTAINADADSFFNWIMNTYHAGKHGEWFNFPKMKRLDNKNIKMIEKSIRQQLYYTGVTAEDLDLFTNPVFGMAFKWSGARSPKQIEETKFSRKLKKHISMSKWRLKQ